MSNVFKLPSKPRKNSTINTLTRDLWMIRDIQDRLLVLEEEIRKAIREHAQNQKPLTQSVTDGTLKKD